MICSLGKIYERYVESDAICMQAKLLSQDLCWMQLTLRVYTYVQLFLLHIELFPSLFMVLLGGNVICLYIIEMNYICTSGKCRQTKTSQLFPAKIRNSRI